MHPAYEHRFDTRHHFLPGDLVKIVPRQPGCNIFFSRVEQVQEHSVKIGAFFRQSPEAPNRCCFNELLDSTDARMIPPSIFIWSGLTNEQILHQWMIVHYN